MKSTTRRFAAAAALAVMGAGVLFAGQTVYPTVAKAGGTGNFYKYKECVATTRAGEQISGVRGKLSNYDVNGYLDQQYHHGVSVTRAGWRLATPPLYDDESWPIYPSEIWDAKYFSGYSTDGKQTFDIVAATHTVTFIFSNGKISASCRIKE